MDIQKRVCNRTEELSLRQHCARCESQCGDVQLDRDREGEWNQPIRLFGLDTQDCAGDEPFAESGVGRSVDTGKISCSRWGHLTLTSKMDVITSS